MDTGKYDFMTTGKRISLDIGTKIHLEIEGVAIPLESYMVGMEPDNYIILKTPRPYPTIKQKLYQGNQCIVKYIFQGTVFAFQTKIIDSISQPFRLLFLEYPKIIQHHDLRDYRRIDCVIPARIVVKDEEKMAAVVDVSKRGCRVQIQIYPGDRVPSIVINDEVSLWAKFPGVEGDLEIHGRVRNIRKSRHEMVLGVVYQEIPREAQEKIAGYLLSVEELFKNRTGG